MTPFLRNDDLAIFVAEIGAVLSERVKPVYMIEKLEVGQKEYRQGV
jgi:hypothetical protein